MEGIPLAPPELKQVHPLGKSPVITDKGKTIAESGAIVEYIIDTYGGGRLKPSPGTDDYWKYVEWMHYAEGSAMFPLLLALMAGFLGDGAALLQPRIDSEIANNLSATSSRACRGAVLRRRGSHRRGHPVAVRYWKQPRAARALPRRRGPIATGCTRPACKRALDPRWAYQLMGRWHAGAVSASPGLPENIPINRGLRGQRKDFADVAREGVDASLMARAAGRSTPS
jgi:hypothetical protein